VQELLHHIPSDFIKFLLVFVFSLLIGLEQRRLYIKIEMETVFGTDRTFTLIGILGYILYIISPKEPILFITGAGAIAAFLAIYYFMKIKLKQKFGLTSIITALITFCLGPLVYTQPLWLVLLIVIGLLVITEIKENLFEFSQKIDSTEFITLAKFLALAGVILPLLPDTPISPEINISPYRFWLSVVIVSAISYLSYLLKKFVFPNAGILLTGILGGLYSSTATTIILAKKSKENPATKGYASAIILATSMMYLRLFLLALFFNQAIAIGLLPWFALFFVLSAGLSFVFWKFKSPEIKTDQPVTIEAQTNPLEFKTALLFAGLFIFFALATSYVFKHFGASGISGMAFIVGVTDIDPFILNLFQHTGKIADTIVVLAVVNAVSSNNILKLIYALLFGDKSLRKELIIGFSALIASGIVASVVLNSIG